jgi:hypothetical protein
MCTPLGLWLSWGGHFLPQLASRVGHPNLSIGHQDKVLLYGKEHIAKVAISLRTAREGLAH